MKTIKISEATPIQLDWLVAKCEGRPNLHAVNGKVWSFYEADDDENAPLKYRILNPSMCGNRCVYTSDWSHGGPIIEREKIAVAYEPSLVYDDSCRWKAMCAMSDNDNQYGPTPLIAAMRCYVASKIGDEVEIPEELK